MSYSVSGLTCVVTILPESASNSAYGLFTIFLPLYMMGNLVNLDQCNTLIRFSPKFQDHEKYILSATDMFYRRYLFLPNKWTETAKR